MPQVCENQMEVDSNYGNLPQSEPESDSEIQSQTITHNEPAPEPDTEEKLIAAQVLGSLKSKPYTSSKFISRVSEFPILNKALSVYDLGKQKSTVLKMGAEKIESSVRSVVNPLANYIDVEQIDDFACRQLDRLEQSSNSFNSAKKTKQLNADQSSNKNLKQNLNNAVESRKAKNANFEIRRAYFSTSNFFSKSATATAQPEQQTPEREIDTEQRPSRWEMLIGSARVHADTLRKDTSKKITFILEWLQYAIDTIQRYSEDINQLLQTAKKALLSLLNSSKDSLVYAKGSFVLFIRDAKQRIALAVNDMVNIMKSVIETISKYAGAVLPKDARNQVRYLLLELPKRCTNLSSFVDLSSASTPTSLPTSPSASTSTPISMVSSPQTTSGSAASTAHNSVTSNMHLAEIKDRIISIEVSGHKLVNFAAESNTMLENIQNVFKNIACNFETWFESNPQYSIVNNFSMLNPRASTSPDTKIDILMDVDSEPITVAAISSPTSPTVSNSKSQKPGSISNVIHLSKLNSSPVSIPGSADTSLHPIELPSIVKNLINDTKSVNPSK